MSEQTGPDPAARDDRSDETVGPDTDDADDTADEMADIDLPEGVVLDDFVGTPPAGDAHLDEVASRDQSAVHDGRQDPDSEDDA